MSFYNTGNPVPSIDPRDLDDNAKHVDEIVNSTFPTFTDRLGVERKTLAGLEADVAPALTLRDDLAEPDGAGLSGFHEGTVLSALDGTTPIGPRTQRVDQPATGSPKGPFIARPLFTVAPMSIYVDPAIGNDLNPGTLASPLKTIDAAIQKVPESIFHKVRIYLLDGDYSGQQILLFNYYVTARSSAGFKIFGHVASVDGEAHPVYTDTNPSAVVIDGEHIFSGIRGTEEFTLAGIKFLKSWIEPYDSYVVLDQCIMDTGYDVIGFSPKICITGHNGKVKAITTTFQNCNKIFDAEGHMIGLFENCTAINILDVPIEARNGSEAYVKNSPTFNQTWPGGRNRSVNGSIIYDRRYSDVGSVNYLSRMNAAADEVLFLQGGNGVALGGERGAGAGYYGRNHAALPGYNIQEFGTSTAARMIFRFKGVGTSKDIFTVFPLGDVKASNSVVFSINADTAPNLLTNGNAMLYVLANGDVYVQSMNGGVRKATKILDFATATVQP